MNGQTVAFLNFCLCSQFIFNSIPACRCGHRAGGVVAEAGVAVPRGEPADEGGRGGRPVRGRGPRRHRHQDNQEGPRGLGRSQHLRNVILTRDEAISGLAFSTYDDESSF